MSPVHVMLYSRLQANPVSTIDDKIVELIFLALKPLLRLPFCFLDMYLVQ